MRSRAVLVRRRHGRNGGSLCRGSCEVRDSPSGGLQQCGDRVYTSRCGNAERIVLLEDGCVIECVFLLLCVLSIYFTLTCNCCASA